MTIYDFNRSPKPAVANVDSSSADLKQVFNSYGIQFNARLPHGATLFGGLGLDRLQQNTCALQDNPNLNRFCDDANLDANLPVGDPARGYSLPYLRNGKLSGTLPIGWGVTMSGSFQSNQGYPNRSLTTTRTTGGTSWQVSTTTTYPTLNGQAYCPACPNGVAPWAANQRVVPTTVNGTDASTILTVQLIPYSSDDQFTDRVNQLDLKFAKTFSVNRFKIAPTLELFNVFNSNSVILQRQTNYVPPPASVNGIAQPTLFEQPSGILNGRIMGIGAQVRW
jgi:hypothetical protein